MVATPCRAAASSTAPSLVTIVQSTRNSPPFVRSNGIDRRRQAGIRLRQHGDPRLKHQLALREARRGSGFVETDRTSDLDVFGSTLAFRNIQAKGEGVLAVFRCSNGNGKHGLYAMWSFASVVDDEW